MSAFLRDPGAAEQILTSLGMTERFRCDHHTSRAAVPADAETV